MKALRTQPISEIRRQGRRWMNTPASQPGYRSTGFFPAAGPARDAVVPAITPVASAKDGSTRLGLGTSRPAAEGPNVLRKIRVQYHVEFARRRTRVTAADSGLTT